jgi:hypothetical protein
MIEFLFDLLYVATGPVILLGVIGIVLGFAALVATSLRGDR